MDTPFTAQAVHDQVKKLLKVDISGHFWTILDYSVPYLDMK